MRFTQSGHRLLFGRFDRIASGPLGGPAAVFNLGVRGLVGGLTHSRMMARIAYAVTQPMVLLDRFVPESWRVDMRPERTSSVGWTTVRPRIRCPRRLPRVTVIDGDGEADARSELLWSRT